MSKICRECNTENPDHATRCSMCGAFLSANKSSLKLDWQKAGIKEDDSVQSNGWFKNYLLESILMTACCCAPMGILGIVFSAQAKSSFKKKDYETADRKASAARRCLIWGLFIALILFIILYVSGAWDE